MIQEIGTEEIQCVVTDKFDIYIDNKLHHLVANDLVWLTEPNAEQLIREGIVVAALESLPSDSVIAKPVIASKLSEPVITDKLSEKPKRGRTKKPKED